jgi:hypothetical protein
MAGGVKFLASKLKCKYIDSLYRSGLLKKSSFKISSCSLILLVEMEQPFVSMKMASLRGAIII